MFTNRYLTLTRLGIKIIPAFDTMLLPKRISTFVFRRFFNSGPSTLSEEELIKFRKLADQWWDPKGAFKALHSLNKLR